jgi:hypothetical protein
MQLQREKGMIVTEYNHLTDAELIRLAMSKEKLTPLEQELLTRFSQKVERGF